MSEAPMMSPIELHDEVVETFPTTPMQQRLLLQHRLYPGDGSFNLAYAFQIEGAVNTQRLTRCLDQVLEGCAGLNTSFPDQPGPPVALVHRQGGGLTVSQLSGHPDLDSEMAAVTRWLAERADMPIAPDRWPLYHVELHVGQHASYLTMLASHLVGDAYTFYNVIQVVGNLYGEREPWPVVARQLSLHPASAPGPGPNDTSTADDVRAFRELLGQTSALTHDRLAVERSGTTGQAGRHARALLPRVVSAQLNRNGGLINRHGPFAVFLAAYAVVLSVLTGRRDVVIGVPLANRRGQVQRQSFGYFVNTLPLPLEIGAELTFDDLAATVATKVFTLLRHQGFDFASNAEAVVGQGRTGPLSLDNVFTYYKQPLLPDLDGCSVTALTIPRQLVKYPLGMTVEDRHGDYLLEVEHLPRFAPADPLGCVTNVLARVAADASVRLSGLGLLGPEQEQALTEVAGSPRTYPTPPSLDEWFRDIAAERGDAVAVRDTTGELSYAELDAEVDRVAGHLRALTSSGSVAIAMRRSRHLVSVILGTLRAGKTYVPIDPEAPLERARHIMSQFENLLLVADAGLLPEVSGRRVDPAELLQEQPPPVTPRETASPTFTVDRRSQVAYVIFTSGSTGVPKGVEVTHQNVLRLLRSADEHFDFGPRDTWCLFHSYAFDFSVWEIFGSLLHGGRLVVVPEATVRSPEDFAQLLIREHVTVLNQTPSAFRRLTAVLRAKDRLDVRWVVFGGEALYLDVLRPWFESQGRTARLVNMYGITETTVHVTYLEVDPDLVGTERDSVIGRPLGDLSVTVVDHNLNRCPLGVSGELLVSGAGVAAGYHHAPGLTRGRFLRGTPYGDVVYRTGDLGYLRPDGLLVYLGRVDQQVQLRGYRVELGEVEAGLLAVEGVQQGIVRLEQPAGAEPRLVGYLVGNVPGDSEIRAQLARRLPHYMVPSVFVRLAEIPLTVNGKVAEQLLPSSVTTSTPGPGDIGGDELAASVARIWAETVQTGTVGVSDNFFDVGGTSMHVAEVHRRLQTELGGTDLAMVDLFEFPTPTALANRLRASESCRVVPITRSRAPRPGAAVRAAPDSQLFRHQLTRSAPGSESATDFPREASR